MNTIPQLYPESLSGHIIPESTTTTFRECVSGDAINKDSRTLPSSAARTTSAILTPAVDGDAPNRPLPPLPTQSPKGEGIKKRGKRGPPPVQWTPSKERQFARLQQMTTVNIKDIPVVMRDDKLRFEYVQAPLLTSSELCEANTGAMLLGNAMPKTNSATISGIDRTSFGQQMRMKLKRG